MTVTPTKPASKTEYTITWEKLPPDFPLPDDPVDNIIQPELAIALKESLGIAGLTTESMLIATNFGICATVNGKTVVKAPDWVYVPNVPPLTSGKIRRSYTPNAEGQKVAIVMEFLSHTDGGEYSVKRTYPYGKWWFYERILEVPVYVIFDPETGDLEVYHLTSGIYEQQNPNEENRYWFADLGLFLGVWQGTRFDLNAFWLRWWDAEGNMLLWSMEKDLLTKEQLQAAQQQAEAAQQQAEAAQQQAEAAQQQAEAAQQQVEIERNRAEILAQQLRSLGIDPDSLV